MSSRKKRKLTLLQGKVEADASAAKSTQDAARLQGQCAAEVDQIMRICVSIGGTAFVLEGGCSLHALDELRVRLMRLLSDFGPEVSRLQLAAQQAEKK